MIDNKSYLISFVATIQGGKIAVTQLQQMEQATGKIDKVLPKATKGVNNFSRMLKRSAMVIPIWLLLRTVIMGVIRTVGDMVRSWAEMDDAMARIKTVVSASSKSVEADMIAIRRTILDMAVKTRTPMKELSETFYFLRTAGLSTQEAIGAFKPTIDAMVGTMNSGKDTARLMAGIFNTMGKYILPETASVTEKFTRIADVLTYTYATQDVQLQELTQSYMKLAPYISGMGDSFLEIITMLGFLNTRLLRAGRTGRLTGRAFIQITKNADKLADIFDISFDPKKPLSFLGIIGQIHKQLGAMGKITAEQSGAIEKVFATRGAVMVRLMIESWKEWGEVLQRAGVNADNFAEKMRNIREATIPAQMERFRNILRVLFQDFVTATVGAGDFVEALKGINDTLEKARLPMEAWGSTLGWIGEVLGRTSLQFMEIDNLITRIFYGKPIPKAWQDYVKTVGTADVAVRSFASYLEEMERKQQARVIEAKAEAEIQTKLAEDKAIAQESNNLKLKAQLNIMKELGASQLSILKWKEKQLGANEREHLSNKELLELQKAREAVIVATIKQHRDLADTYLKAELNMMKTIGAHQVDILKHEINILKASKNLEASRKRQIKIAEVIAKLKRLEKVDTKKLREDVKGALLNDKAITEEKLKELELTEALSGAAGERLRIEELRLKLAQENLVLKGQYVKTFARAELDMAKAMGANELQLLDIERRHFELTKDKLGKEARITEELRLQNKEAQLFEKTIRKQLDAIEDLMLEYATADPLDKPMIAEFYKLAKLDAEKLKEVVKANSYEASVLEKNWNRLTEAQRRATAIPVFTGKVPIEMLKDYAEYLEKIGTAETATKKEFEDMFAPTKATVFWTSWTERMMEAVQKFKAEYQNVTKITPEKVGVEAEGVGLKQQIIKNLELFVKGKTVAQMTIEAMTIQLPPDTLERVSFETASIVERRLKENEDLQKFLAEVIRPHL